MNSTVLIQTSSHSVPSTPSWFGEVVLIIEHLRKQGVLSKLSERMRFRRRRFGQYEVIDFLAVLFGYAISGERTLERRSRHGKDEIDRPGRRWLAQEKRT